MSVNSETVHEYHQEEFELGLPPKPQRVFVRRGTGVSEAIMLVAEFHHAFDLPVSNRPQRVLPFGLADLRVDLLEEEVGELREAVEASNLTKIADALGDILYVTYGAALTWGVDLDAVLREIHRSNMTKLGSDGKPILRHDGKVLKPDGYTPPNIERALLDQPPLFLD
ncbi:nucleoside triphosphate pyrophosphohydrolase family protein [Herbiconiux sp. CPCC 205716]|uniref:Nucleoside triphosphate pyrophosphohydrolase family protein n=1 Tax=Herbiconiux gentiana TaxID=2970912 RepID=A0ABT2GED1_9MICO|nr:nucleoside triphosphate pyrophosphohydrolase family protein [Herbiconiux gentiana]MCS5714592.1 nucleoside triphosphate pyrophosphohydrolase family protein [Herbiconiux gentiana]